MMTFKYLGIFAISLAILALLPSCASGRSNESLTLASRVSKLVDETTTSAKRQERALRELEALGSQTVPYLVGHLGDMRPLAKRQLSLENHALNASEGLRHYSPDTVHDALSAVLSQITGEHFVFVYNGAAPQEREDNRRRWVDWCRSKFPTQAMTCAGWNLTSVGPTQRVYLRRKERPIGPHVSEQVTLRYDPQDREVTLLRQDVAEALKP